MANTLVINNANITISIKGLALSHYKEGNKFWETRFLRGIEGHNLTLTIKKNGLVIFSEAIDVSERISIVSSQAEPIPSHYNEGDNKDFSHLVDFNSPEMVGNDFKFNDKPTTILTIFNACFYSKTLSTRQYTIQKNGVDLFTRQIGIITGGDIVSLGQTEVTFAGSPNRNQTLTAEPGVLYEVIFDNDCPHPPSDGSSDFDLYDEFIQTTDKYTLVGPDVIGFQDPPPDEKAPPCASGGGGG